MNEWNEQSMPVLHLRSASWFPVDRMELGILTLPVPEALSRTDLLGRRVVRRLGAVKLETIEEPVALQPELPAVDEALLFNAESEVVAAVRLGIAQRSLLNPLPPVRRPTFLQYRHDRYGQLLAKAV